MFKKCSWQSKNDEKRHVKCIYDEKQNNSNYGDQFVKHDF